MHIFTLLANKAVRHSAIYTKGFYFVNGEKLTPEQFNAKYPIECRNVENRQNTHWFKKGANVDKTKIV